MSEQSEQLLLSLRPRSSIDFASFFVDTVNAELVHALRQWLQQARAGVFFISGAQGSGRSHLLQAACGASPDALYLPLLDLQSEAPAALLEGLENHALLCLDDIDAVTADRDWCEALFHLFNRHVGSASAEGAGRWLVSAQIPVAQLSCALPDLQSRLSWGGGYRLAPLDDSGRRQMLQLHARQRGMTLADDVASYILQRHARDPQALIALLELIDRESLRNRQRVSVPFVRKLLGEFI